MNVIALSSNARNSVDFLAYAAGSWPLAKGQQPQTINKVLVKVGNALIGYIEYKKTMQHITGTSKFNHCLGRIREIEKIIRHRHPEDRNIVPDTDDSDTYARLIACLMYVEYGPEGVEKHLKGWMGRWYPWADQSYIDGVIDQIHPHYNPLSADYLADHLQLTYAERGLLNIRTIGACDVSKRQRKKIQKEKHRRLDRDAKRAKRRANGATPRNQSLSQTKPWEAEGISRSTWERRRAQQRD